MKIILPGDAIAKKNSQRIVRVGGSRRPSIRPSLAYDRWEKQALTQIMLDRHQAWDGEYPVDLIFSFYRATKRKFDFSNMLEGSQDVLQKAGILVDDDSKHVRPVIQGGWVDKENPRTEITIISKQLKRRSP